jgi:ribosomal protein L37AE/L43A
MKCPDCEKEARRTTNTKVYYCKNCDIFFVEEEKNNKYNFVRNGEA